MSGPVVNLWLWIAPDSSKVLGQGLSKETAYQNAQLRHADPRGYPCAASLSSFPAEHANPLKTIVEGLWAAYPPTLRAAEPEEGTNVKPIRGGEDKRGEDKAKP